jgi:hypothetical protein
MEPKPWGLLYSYVFTIAFYKYSSNRENLAWISQPVFTTRVKQEPENELGKDKRPQAQIQQVNLFANYFLVLSCEILFQNIEVNFIILKESSIWFEYLVPSQPYKNS